MKEADRECERKRERDMDKQAKYCETYRKKRKLEVLEQRPQRLEKGILHCPRHAASLHFT